MDSLIYQELRNEIDSLKHIKETMDKRVKELHEEEMRYLEEIPLYKKQAKEAKETHAVLAGKTVSLMAELEGVRKELVKTQGLVIVEQRALESLKETQKKIIEETKAMNEQIKQRHEQLKQRELAVGDMEKSSELREVGCKNREFDLDKREVEIKNKESALDHAHQDLNDSLKSHEKNIKIHANNVRSLAEQRKFHEEDKNVLQDKIYKADKLVKDHINLKASLLLQSEKLATSIKEVDEKRGFLDKQEQSLREREDFLRFKKSKFSQLVEDAGLPKEIKEAINKET